MTKSKKGNVQPGTILCGCGDEVPWRDWVRHRKEKHAR